MYSFGFASLTFTGTAATYTFSSNVVLTGFVINNSGACQQFSAEYVKITKVSNLGTDIAVPIKYTAMAVFNLVQTGDISLEVFELEAGTYTFYFLNLGLDDLGHTITDGGIMFLNR